MILNHVRDLVGNPSEFVKKGHLYDKLMEKVEPSWISQILLVKYSRLINALLKEI